MFQKRKKTERQENCVRTTGEPMLFVPYFQCRLIDCLFILFFLRPIAYVFGLNITKGKTFDKTKKKKNNDNHQPNIKMQNRREGEMWVSYA